MRQPALGPRPLLQAEPNLLARLLGTIILTEMVRIPSQAITPIIFRL